MLPGLQLRGAVVSALPAELAAIVVEYPRELHTRAPLGVRASIADASIRAAAVRWRPKLPGA